MRPLQHAVRSLLRHSVALKGALYRLVWMLPERFRGADPIRRALLDVASNPGPVRFLNIGANDGLSGDPLREFVLTRRWTGVLVEPVPFVFERLATAYRSVPGVTCANVAISDSDAPRPLWYLRKNYALEPGYDQIASFNKEHLLAHAGTLFPGCERYLDSMVVQCLTLDSLLAKYGIDRVDVLLIDTEGYDRMVLDQVDFSRIGPRLVIFEHEHLSAADSLVCEQRLAAHGYTLARFAGNTIARRA